MPIKTAVHPALARSLLDPPRAAEVRPTPALQDCPAPSSLWRFEQCARPLLGTGSREPRHEEDTGPLSVSGAPRARGAPPHPVECLVPRSALVGAPSTAQPVLRRPREHCQPCLVCAQGAPVSHPHRCWPPKAVCYLLPASLQPGSSLWAGAVFPTSLCPVLTWGPRQRPEGGRRVTLSSWRLPGPGRSTSSGCAGRFLVSTC